MNIRTLLLFTTLAAGFATASVAQQTGGQMPTGGSSGQMATAADLPEGCRTAARAGDGGQMMGGMQGHMQGQMSQNMQGMMGGATETQRGFVKP